MITRIGYLDLYKTLSDKVLGINATALY